MADRGSNHSWWYDFFEYLLAFCCCVAAVVVLIFNEFFVWFKRLLEEKFRELEILQKAEKGYITKLEESKTKLNVSVLQKYTFTHCSIGVLPYCHRIRQPAS